MVVTQDALIVTDQFQEPFKSVLDDIITRGHEFYDIFRNYFYVPFKHRKLEIGIVNSDDLNACASSTADKDTILINRGAVEQIYGTTLGLFSIPDFLPAIGNISLEIKPSRHFPNGFPRMPLPKVDQAMDKVETLIPIDRDRSTFAYLLADAAFEFLIFHEIGHILGGHLDIWKAKGNGNYFMEFESNRLNSEDTKLRRVFEWDADAFACHVMLGSGLDRRSGEYLQDIMKTGGMNSYELMFVALIDAVSILFRLLYSDDSFDTITDIRRVYPHPAVRSYLVLNCALTREHSKGNLTTIQAAPLLQLSILNLNHIWTQFQLPGQYPQEPGTDWVGQMVLGAKQVFNEFTDARPLLNKHSRLPRAWDDINWPDA